MERDAPGHHTTHLDIKNPYGKAIKNVFQFHTFFIFSQQSIYIPPHDQAL